MKWAFEVGDPVRAVDGEDIDGVVFFAPEMRKLVGAVGIVKSRYNIDGEQLYQVNFGEGIPKWYYWHWSWLKASITEFDEKEIDDFMNEFVTG